MKRTKKLDKFLIRQGFLPKDLKIGINAEWLADTFKKLELLHDEPDSISENEWIEALQQTATVISHDDRIPGKEALVNPKVEELPLVQIDPYIRGIVRWLNMMGIYTIYSCDGEGRGRAHIGLLNELTARQATIIQACTPESVKIKLEKKRVTFLYRQGNRNELLTIAEHLYNVWKNPEKFTEYRLELLKQRLVALLSINGPSGRENGIRRTLHRWLRTKTDWLKIDSYGNLLGRVDCGNGPVILLSAHMDTVLSFPAAREIIDDGKTFRSSNGILGADDRAGIAVVLEILDFIRYSRFQGTLKIAFTVEEEIGCLGSRNIDPDFLKDVDAAIVVDRKGTRDIVTSYADMVPFCAEDYGRIFERAGELAGMPDWNITPGGRSDASVFAEYGIPSVNLSVGYFNPHTEDEILDYKSTLETIMLLEKVFDEQLIRKELLQMV